MVQLGDSNVQRKAAHILAQADHIETTTIKITVYRDEWPGEWEAFGQAPLREVINKFPLFRLCKGNRCGGECGRYHAPVDIEMDSVIVDIWSRLLQTLKGHKSSQANADVFQALMRIPEICFKHLHQISGNAGVYIEPRQENGTPPENHGQGTCHLQIWHEIWSSCMGQRCRGNAWAYRTRGDISQLCGAEGLRNQAIGTWHLESRS